MKPYNLWLDDDDKQRIREVQELYHCESQSQAVRTALKIAATNPRINQLVLPVTSKHSKTKSAPKKVSPSKTLLRIAQYAEKHNAVTSALPEDFSARPDFYTYGNYWQNKLVEPQ
jgi:hypothetical protein